MFKPGDRAAFVLDGHEAEIIWTSHDGQRVMVRGFRAQFPATDFRAVPATGAIATVGEKSNG